MFHVDFVHLIIKNNGPNYQLCPDITSDLVRNEHFLETNCLMIHFTCPAVLICNYVAKKKCATQNLLFVKVLTDKMNFTLLFNEIFRTA